MPALPDPLHPAIVHFPIVLILLGTVVAAAAIFWRKHFVPVWAAALLAVGAVGAWVAMETGESDGGMVESMAPPAAALLDAHEDWAERTLTAAAVAAIVAIASVMLFKFPRLARAVAVATFLAAGAASYAVYETGHRGGALVFRHGTGINVAAANEGGPTLAPLQKGAVHKDLDDD
jgi:uncharacterized membrane protein